MSTKRALLFANESSRSLPKSNQFGRDYSYQYSNINLNQTHKCEIASNFVQSDSKNSLKNNQSKNNGFVDNYKNDKTDDSWKTKDLSKSAFGQQNYLQKNDSKKEWKSKNVEILNNKSSSTLSLHIAAYENCSLEEPQNEKVLRKSEQINDKFAFLPCRRQQIEDESKSTETMSFKLSQKLFNPNEIKEKQMLSVSNLGRRVSSSSGILSSCSRLYSTEKVWEDPWKHALPQQDQTLTDFKESSTDWSYVERLLPKETIPPMPLNCGILPSGWRPPMNPAPPLPYFIGRNRRHQPSLYLERRRDQLNPDTMDLEYVELVSMNEISGDVFACEKDLSEFLEKELGHPVATYIDEIKGKIKVKGAHRALLEKFIFEKGF